MVPAPPADTTMVPPAAVAPAPPPVAAPPVAETTEPAAPPPGHRKRRAQPQEAAEEAAEARPAAWRRGVLVMPFVGFQAVQGIAADDYDAGPRVGLLMGAHAAPAVSLNVELAMDFLNPKESPMAPRGSSISGRDLTIAFSPLFHASAGVGEFVIGPKLGFWSSSLESKTPGLDTQQASQTGWAYGLNMGAFAGVGDTAALGALLSYQMTYLSQTCARQGDLTDCDIHASAPQILSFNLAGMF
jgi:hypothetical protein